MMTVTLNDRNEIPVLGLGTFRLEPDECEFAVETALRNGYRLIDTANIYMNEKAVGRAIKKSGVDRSEIYLTSNLWPAEYLYEQAKDAINRTLKRLGTKYVDLMLLHQPYGDYLGAWKALEEAVQAGKIKSIGLSNFGQKPLNDILAHAHIKPAVLQTECHPYLQEKVMKEVLKVNKIALEAWYPLGHADKTLFQDPLFIRLADKYNKSVVQIILRWHIQIGNIVIPGSKNEKHIIDNQDVFDFELAPEDMAEIAKLDKNKRYFKYPEFMKKFIFLTMKQDYDSQK